MSRMSSRVEPLAVDLGVEEAAEEVVAPLDLALVEHVVEVVVDRLRRSRFW